MTLLTILREVLCGVLGDVFRGARLLRLRRIAGARRGAGGARLAEVVVHAGLEPALAAAQRLGDRCARACARGRSRGSRARRTRARHEMALASVLLTTNPAAVPATSPVRMYAYTLPRSRAGK